MTTLAISLGLALVFSPLAAAMAFLISYSEYRHHYPDSRRPRQLAARTAAATMLFFLALSLAVGLALRGIIGEGP